MDAIDLSIFEAVARTGSMTRAAAVVHTVQSNVTARIRALERELGVQLVARHSRGVTLTNAGQVLLPYAVAVGRLLAEAARATADTSTPRGPLRVGSLETTAARRLPPVLAAYTTAYPEVDVSLQTGTTAELVAAVLEHRLEGALVVGPVCHPALIEEPMVEEELVLVTATSDAPIDATFAPAGELKILVLRAGCSYRQRLEAILAARGVATVRVQEFGTIDAILGCAAAGIGVTLLPRSVVEGARLGAPIAVQALPPEQAHVTTVFIRRRDAFVSSALTCFLAACKRHAARETASQR